MITDSGKLHIKRYLAQYVPAIGQSISFGIGADAEASTNSSLAFEVASSAVNLVTYDFNANKLIFKATVPPALGAKIYEVGLHYGTLPEYNSRVVTTFDSATEAWNVGGGTWNANSRIGLDVLRHTPAANASTTSILNGIYLNFLENSDSDVFKFALNIGNANTSAVRFRIMTSPANYFEYNNNSSAVTSAGYRVLEVPRGSMSVTGTPDWSNITRIEVTTVSKSTGASQVDFDSIRIDDKINTTDRILVARKVLATPSVSLDGQAQDIEFALDINI